jgi:hypothetical protein
MGGSPVSLSTTSGSGLPGSSPVSRGLVLSRKQVYAVGITRWEVRGQVRMRRWQLIGDQSVGVHNGPFAEHGHL